MAQLSRGSAQFLTLLPVLPVLRAPFNKTVSLPMAIRMIDGRASGLQQCAAKIADVLSFKIGLHRGDVANVHDRHTEYVQQNESIRTHHAGARHTCQEFNLWAYLCTGCALICELGVHQCECVSTLAKLCA
jgi:hypothetical protein